MDKILTVVIPTYNMEQYIARCLDSLLIKENFDKLDILVIIDGGKDRSSEIAHTYQNKYPECISVIDKDNGNYGSCINSGLKKARGKYIKVLDSDDFFNTSNFQLFVNELIQSDSDLILSDFNIVENGVLKQTISFNIKSNKELLFQDINIEYFAMHSVAYKTEILRQIDYVQTERISYTDQEWIFYPIVAVNSVKYLNYNVYQYQLGRDGQTMDPVIHARSIMHEILIIKRMLEYIENFDFTSVSCSHSVYLNNRVRTRVLQLYKMILIDIPDELYDFKTIKELDSFVKQHSQSIDRDLDHYIPRRLIPIKYIRIWRRSNYRLPAFLRKIIYKYS